MNKPIEPRQLAVEILIDVNEHGAYSNIALKKAFEARNTLSTLDKAFITELVNGTLKNQIQIDYIIEQFVKMNLKKVSPKILNILRMGVYQIVSMDKVPAAAACNESVKLAKKYGHAGTVKFTNGVLRNIVRNLNDLPLPSEKDTVDYISVKYSHPRWLIKKWLQYYTREFVEDLCHSNNQPPYVTLRVNVLKASGVEVEKLLTNENIQVEKGMLLHSALRVKGLHDFSKLDVYTKGLVQVQDESSMLVGYIANPKPGNKVLDVTSAPGGKATHIAELMGNEGEVIARDLHEHKIKLIDSTAKRLGFTCIKTEVFDATKLDSSFIEKADIVLVDAPCSGLGIIRKKPDIKIKKQECEFKEIINIQRNILATCQQYVKPDGRLIYSTCTINPEENILQVEWFMQKYGFELEPIIEYLPEILQNEESAAQGYIQLYPHIHHCDGFFIARLKRKR